MLEIRHERVGDEPGIDNVVRRAFDRAAEADLVQALRTAGALQVSLVACDGAEVVGHIAFTPVTLKHEVDLPPRLLGLAPLAVLPGRQRQGIGGALVRAGLAECAAQGVPAVVVLGDPDYYGRFGFVTASDRGLACEYDVPLEAFQVRESIPEGLKSLSGQVRFHPAFAGV